MTHSHDLPLGPGLELLTFEVLNGKNDIGARERNGLLLGRSRKARSAQGRAPAAGQIDG